MDRDRVLERIWRRDHTVWKDDPTEITDRLGWLTVSDLMRERLPELAGVRDAGGRRRVRDARCCSGWAARASRPRCSCRRSAPRTARSSSSCSTRRTRRRSSASPVHLGFARTLFIVASKSGTTIETLQPLRLLLGARLRTARSSSRSRTRARRSTTWRASDGFRARLPQPGGHRRALLGAVVLRPRAGGADRGTAARAARRGRGDAVRVRTRACRPPENPARGSARLLGALGQAGRDKLTLVLPEELASFGDWVEQLDRRVDGQGGRRHRPGRRASRSARRTSTATIGSSSRSASTRALDALERLGHPVVRIAFEDREQLGGEFFRWEFATAVAGHVLGINPFDQPNVQEAKDATTAILAAGTSRTPAPTTSRALLERTIEPGDYVAILAYLAGRPETEDAIAAGAARDPRPAIASRRRRGSGRASCTRPGSCTRAGRTAGSSSRSPTERERPTCQSPGSRSRSGR